MNRKRSHEDLDDADECLPISKRINSLHLEGKTHGNRLCQNQLDGFNDAETLRSLPFPASQESLPCPLSPYGLTLPVTHHQGNVHKHSAPHSSQRGHPEHNGACSSHSNMPPPPPPHLAHMNGLYSGHLQPPSSSPNDHLRMDPHHPNPHHHYPPGLPALFGNHHHPAHPHPHHHHLSPATCDIQHINSPPPPYANNNNYSSAMNEFGPLPPGGIGSGGSGLSSGEDVGLGEDIVPDGPYDPELRETENPHYYSTNKQLYEAHLFRIQRNLPDYQLHS